MKKLVLSLAVVGLALFPTLLLAQPPRPPMRPQIAHPAVTARPAMQVHVSHPPALNHIYSAQRPPIVANHAPYHQHTPIYPPVVRPQVIVVPQVIAPPPVIAPAVVVPGYYPPINSGFALTIGGQNGVFSISTGR